MTISQLLNFARFLHDQIKYGVCSFYDLTPPSVIAHTETGYSVTPRHGQPIGVNDQRLKKACFSCAQAGGQAFFVGQREVRKGGILWKKSSNCAYLAPERTLLFYWGLIKYAE